MSDQPGDWKPEPNVLYQCLNCDTLFQHPEPVILDGETIWRCPECYSDEMFGLAPEVVWGLFWHIIAHDFNEVRRHNLRMIAEMHMGPFNPISRDL